MVVSNQETRYHLKCDCFKDKTGRCVMGQTDLNDVTYNFEPLELRIPDPNYKVNEADLQKSI